MRLANGGNRVLLGFAASVVDDEVVVLDVVVVVEVVATLCETFGGLADVGRSNTGSSSGIPRCSGASMTTGWMSVDLWKLPKSGVLKNESICGSVA